MRSATVEIDDLFLRRWSPRAMSGEAITREELMPLCEAARWAPSAMNNQPWRFVYALRDTPSWAPFFDLLVERNQRWCRQAGALVVLISRDTFAPTGAPARTHSFDTGAAWMSLALQGTLAGLVVHGMQGFDYERARGVCAVPDGYTVECMVAIGKPGDPGALPDDLREREHPSDRRPLDEIMLEGRLPAPALAPTAG